jgi:superfamily II DNA/RNA helicase
MRLMRAHSTHRSRLRDTLQSEEYKEAKVLIFVATKRKTEMLAEKLLDAGYVTAARVHD